MKGRLLARPREDGESIMFKRDFATREPLMEADPATFFITGHYRNAPCILARLDRITAADVRKLLGRSIELDRPKPRRPP